MAKILRMLRTGQPFGVCVGDADHIYSFRAADFTILMGFQEDFGDGLR